MFICGWLTPAAALRLCRSEELPVSLVVRWNKDCCALNKEIRPGAFGKKEENENGPFNEGKEENRQSQDGERLLYYLALGEFLMFLGTLLSGTGQIEKFSRKYLERMVYVIRYMQDMDGRKKHHFCYE